MLLLEDDEGKNCAYYFVRRWRGTIALRQQRDHLLESLLYHRLDMDPAFVKEYGTRARHEATGT